MRMTMRAAAGIVGLYAFAVVIAAAPGGQEAKEPERVPVLAELFTSEGCSSCPAADMMLRRLVANQPVAGVEIIALGEHVTYWDRLGWKDLFSSMQFTARQVAYAKRLGADEVYTPQLVIDGRAEVVGTDWNAVRGALAEAAKVPRATVRVTAEPSPDGSVMVVGVAVVGLPEASSLDVEVVGAILEDDLVTEVLRGENARKRLHHVAVVRDMETIGRLRGGAGTGEFRHDFAIGADWNADNLRVAAFLQDAKTKQVLGSGTTK